MGILLGVSNDGRNVAGFSCFRSSEVIGRNSGTEMSSANIVSWLVFLLSTVVLADMMVVLYISVDFLLFLLDFCRENDGGRRKSDFTL